MKSIFIAIVILLSQSAFADTAYFTGSQYQGPSRSGDIVMFCQYEYMGQRFWQQFDLMYCPMTTEV